MNSHETKLKKLIALSKKASVGPYKLGRWGSEFHGGPLISSKDDVPVALFHHHPGSKQSEIDAKFLIQVANYIRRHGDKMLKCVMADTDAPDEEDDE